MKAALCCIAVLLPFAAVLAAVLVLDSCATIEHHRVAEAERAFAHFAHTGAELFSQPIAFQRYCHYVLILPEKSELSDENIELLMSLNELSDENSVDLVIETKKITDRSLPVLKRLLTLDYLILDKSGASQQGIDELRAAMPDCDVSGLQPR